MIYVTSLFSFFLILLGMIILFFGHRHLLKKNDHKWVSRFLPGVWMFFGVAHTESHSMNSAIYALAELFFVVLHKMSIQMTSPHPCLRKSRSEENEMKTRIPGHPFAIISVFKEQRRSLLLEHI
jgi:hypothetical protein